MQRAGRLRSVRSPRGLSSHVLGGLFPGVLPPNTKASVCVLTLGFCFWSPIFGASVTDYTIKIVFFNFRSRFQVSSMCLLRISSEPRSTELRTAPFWFPATPLMCPVNTKRQNLSKATLGVRLRTRAPCLNWNSTSRGRLNSNSNSSSVYSAMSSSRSDSKPTWASIAHLPGSATQPCATPDSDRQAVWGSCRGHVVR